MTRNFDFENEHFDNDFGPQHLVHSLVTSALDAKVDHRVGQAAAHVELQGEVVDTLWVLFIVVLLGSDPSRHQMVLHSSSQGEIVIPEKRYDTVY